MEKHCILNKRMAQSYLAIIILNKEMTRSYLYLKHDTFFNHSQNGDNIASIQLQNDENSPVKNKRTKSRKIKSVAGVVTC